MSKNVRDCSEDKRKSAPTSQMINKVVKELRGYGISVRKVPNFSRVSDLIRWKENLIDEYDER